MPVTQAPIVKARRDYRPLNILHLAGEWTTEAGKPKIGLHGRNPTQAKTREGDVWGGCQNGKHELLRLQPIVSMDRHV